MKLVISYEQKGYPVEVHPTKRPRLKIEIPLTYDSSFNTVTAIGSLEALQDLVSIANSDGMKNVLLEIEQ